MFIRQPGGAVSGSPFVSQPAVEVVDGSGKPMPWAAGLVAMDVVGNSSDATGSLKSDANLTVEAAGGSASWEDLSIDQPGTYALKATMTLSEALVEATSETFTVAAVELTTCEEVILLCLVLGGSAWAPMASGSILRMVCQGESFLECELQSAG